MDAALATHNANTLPHPHPINSSRPSPYAPRGSQLRLQVCQRDTAQAHGNGPVPSRPQCSILRPLKASHVSPKFGHVRTPYTNSESPKFGHAFSDKLPEGRPSPYRPFTEFVRSSYMAWLVRAGPGFEFHPSLPPSLPASLSPCLPPCLPFSPSLSPSLSLSLSCLSCSLSVYLSINLFMCLSNSRSRSIVPSSFPSLALALALALALFP